MAEFAYLNLQELAEQYGLLSKTPSYSRVQQARQRMAVLKQNRQEYPEMEADYSEVLEYADMLERNGTALAEVLCLARMLARSSRSTDATQKIRDALGAIAQGLNLLVSSEDYTRGEIRRCFIDAFGADAVLPPVSNDSAWESSLFLQKYFAAKQAADTAPLNSAEVRKAAWSTWETRLVAFLQKQTQAPSIPVDLNYLRCSTERSAPATLLPLNLAEASVLRWSDALVAASSVPLSDDADPGYTPVWVAVCALRGLGFELGADWNFAATVRTQEAESETINRLVALLSSPNADSPPGLLVLRTGTSSFTSGWLPSTPVCLSLDSAGCSNIFGQGRLFLGGYLEKRLGGILFEVTGIEEVASAQKLFNTLPPSLKSKPVAISAPTGAQLPVGSSVGGWLFIETPGGAGEAWDRAFAQPQPSSAKAV